MHRCVDLLVYLGAPVAIQGDPRGFGTLKGFGYWGFRPNLVGGDVEVSCRGCEDSGTAGRGCLQYNTETMAKGHTPLAAPWWRGMRGARQRVRIAAVSLSRKQCLRQWGCRHCFHISAAALIEPMKLLRLRRVHGYEYVFKYRLSAGIRPCACCGMREQTRFWWLNCEELARICAYLRRR